MCLLSQTVRLDDTLNFLGGGSGQLCVLSIGLNPSGDSKDNHLQVQNHHDCTRVTRDVLVLGYSGFVHRSPSKNSLVVNLLPQPFTNRLHNNLADLKLHAWHLESVMTIQEDSHKVAKGIKEPHRGSSRRIYGSKWSILGK